MAESKPTEQSDDLINLKHTVERVDQAVDEDAAADIRKIKEQLALIKQALAQIRVAAYRSQSPPQEAALRELDAIIAQLSKYPHS